MENIHSRKARTWTVRDKRRKGRGRIHQWKALNLCNLPIKWAMARIRNISRTLSHDMTHVMSKTMRKWKRGDVLHMATHNMIRPEHEEEALHVCSTWPAISFTWAASATANYGIWLECVWNRSVDDVYHPKWFCYVRFFAIILYRIIKLLEYAIPSAPLSSACPHQVSPQMSFS